MSFELTAENIPFNKKIFALSVGHTEECVDETVYSMSLHFSEACSKANLNMAEAFKAITIAQFEDYLCNILEQKYCNCFKRN